MPTRHVLAIDSRQASSMLIYAPSSPLVATMVLGHGAGAPQSSPFMVAFATDLAARGFAVATFNFLYMEQRRRVPDPMPLLEQCFRAAIEGARAQTESAHPLIVGGKSMGGRIATRLAAAGDDTAASIDGVVVLGYPLHPPGRPQQLRAAHLRHIHVPTLFVQGSRDSFGTPDELGPILRSLPQVSLFVVEDGDHSLSVKGKGAPPRERIYATVEDEIVRWVAGTVIH